VVLRTDLGRSPGGADLLHAAKSTDASLLRLRRAPPADAVFAARSATLPETGAADEPRGQRQAIAFGILIGLVPCDEVPSARAVVRTRRSITCASPGTTAGRTKAAVARDSACGRGNQGVCSPAGSVAVGARRGRSASGASTSAMLLDSTSGLARNVREVERRSGWARRLGIRPARWYSSAFQTSSSV
jgi:hypothetical protein